MNSQGARALTSKILEAHGLSKQKEQMEFQVTTGLQEGQWSSSMEVPYGAQVKQC
jgi:hypothetical protein